MKKWRIRTDIPVKVLDNGKIEEPDVPDVPCIPCIANAKDQRLASEQQKFTSSTKWSGTPARAAALSPWGPPVESPSPPRGSSSGGGTHFSTGKGSAKHIVILGAKGMGNPK